LWYFSFNVNYCFFLLDLGSCPSAAFGSVSSSRKG
jgi:hypothetical protein